MTSPDFAGDIRPEDFPEVFRRVVREIGALVLTQSPALRHEEAQLLSISDHDLILAQRRSHFSLVDIERWVARDFATIKDEILPGSHRV